MSGAQADDHPDSVHLLLLRHGQTASHRGDTPLTGDGRRTSTLAGEHLARAGTGRVAMLHSATLRATQTAALLAEAARRARPVDEPRTAFALRNPDLYVAGERVDMVSSPDALAEQVPALSVEDCAKHAFFAGFMAAPDRIGWWLRHPDPPGDDAAAVAARILAFARSLLDVPPGGASVYVGITHSPVLRSVARQAHGDDPGEPPHLTGLAIRLDHPDRPPQVGPFDPFSYPLPTVKEQA